MQTWIIVLACLCVVMAVAWHLSYTAARLDRLHARVEGSLAALDAQLVRRAEAALEWARAGDLDAASAMLVTTCAAACLQEGDAAVISRDVQRRGISTARADAESALTACLGEVIAQRESDAAQRGDFSAPVASPTGSEAGESFMARTIASEARERLGDACARVELAARFHDEAVRDVRRVRAKPVVRLTHLAGRTHLPEPSDVAAHVEGASRASAWR